LDSTTTPGQIVGRNVRAARDARLLSQRELAERSGVAKITIATLELGQRPHPRRRTVEKLADALGVDIAELLGSDYPKAPRGVPDSLSELLRRRETRTDHLADEWLKDTLEGLSLEDHVRAVREVRDELLAIGPDLARLVEEHSHDPKAMLLFSEASKQFLIARYSLRARRGQEFVPAELGARIDETIRDLEEAGLAMPGAA
jgi:transcriptional regulator with XRE-family HTH domain